MKKHEKNMVLKMSGRLTLFKDANDKPSIYYNLLAQALWKKDLFFGLCYSCCYFSWGNFTSCFFQSNDKWVHDKWVHAFNRNIFIFKFYILLFFLHKDIFTTTYDIPFLQIHTTIYFLFVSCYIINFNQ